MLYTDWETSTGSALRDLFLLPPTDAAWWVSRRRTDGMPLEVVLHTIWLRAAHPLAGEVMPDLAAVAEAGAWARLLLGIRGPAAWRGASRLCTTVLAVRAGRPAPAPRPGPGVTLEQAWRRGQKEAAEAAVVAAEPEEGLAGVLARAAARRPRGWMPVLWWVIWELGQRWGGEAPPLRLAARWQAGPAAAVLDTPALTDAVRLAAADLLMAAGEAWPERARHLAWTVAITGLSRFVPGPRSRRLIWRAAARTASLAAAAGGVAAEADVPAVADPELDADRLWAAAEAGDALGARRLARALGERGEPAVEGLAERMALAFDGPGPLALMALRRAWEASVRRERVGFLEAMAWLTARQVERDAGRYDVY